MKNYSFLRTTYKAAEPPIFIILAAQAAARIFDVDQEIADVGAVALYGLWCGIRNSIKNFRKKVPQ